MVIGSECGKPVPWMKPMRPKSSSAGLAPARGLRFISLRSHGHSLDWLAGKAAQANPFSRASGYDQCDREGWECPGWASEGNVQFAIAKSGSLAVCR